MSRKRAGGSFSRKLPSDEFTISIDNGDGVSLPTEIWLRILQYAHWKDLCSFASVSKQCRELRQSATLDQRLEGTLRIRNPETTQLNQREFGKLLHRWNRLLVGGVRSKLTFEGLPLQFPSHHGYTQDELRVLCKQLQLNNDDDKLLVPPLLTGVESVVMIRSQLQHLVTPVGPFLGQLFPNLCELEVRDVDISRPTFWSTLAQACPNIHTLRYKSAAITTGQERTCSGIDIAGNRLAQMKSLRELHLDRNSFFLLPAGAPIAHVLATVRGQLERVSLPRFCVIVGPHAEDNEQQQRNLRQQRQPQRLLKLTQSALERFVGQAPKLRWLCSDLEPDRCQRLSSERPEITFVSSS